MSLIDEYNAMFCNQSNEDVVTKKIKSLSERLSEISMEIELLDAQLSCVLDQRDKAFERIKVLRIQRDKGVRFPPFVSLSNGVLEGLFLIGCVCFVFVECRVFPKPCCYEESFRIGCFWKC